MFSMFAWLSSVKKNRRFLALTPLSATGYADKYPNKTPRGFLPAL
jgi:hypothetical protein